MFKKNHVISRTLILSAIVLLFSTLFSVNTSSAAIVWQDNFDDGNHDGWDIDVGDFGISSDRLVATGVGVVGWAFIDHPSTVAYGHWSFDVLSEDAPQNHTYVYIIKGVVDTPNYRLAIWTGSFGIWASGPGVTMIKTNYTGTYSIAEWFPGTALSGLHSYNVTRDNTGEFNIYVDGTLRLTFTDNEITTSSEFRYGSQLNSGIDNIVVGDLPSGTTTGSTTPPIPGFPLLAIILAVPLALSLAIVIRRRNQH